MRASGGKRRAGFVAGLHGGSAAGVAIARSAGRRSPDNAAFRSCRARRGDRPRLRGIRPTSSAEQDVAAPPAACTTRRSPDARAVGTDRIQPTAARIQMGGVALIAGTRTALFVGRNGLGPFCYGNGTGDKSLQPRQHEHGRRALCYDPTNVGQGPARLSVSLPDVGLRSDELGRRFAPGSAIRGRSNPTVCGRSSCRSPKPACASAASALRCRRAALSTSHRSHADRDGYAVPPPDSRLPHPMSEPAVVFDRSGRNSAAASGTTALRDALTALVKWPFTRRASTTRSTRRSSGRCRTCRSRSSRGEAIGIIGAERRRQVDRAQAAHQDPEADERALPRARPGRRADRDRRRLSSRPDRPREPVPAGRDPRDDAAPRSPRKLDAIVDFCGHPRFHRHAGEALLVRHERAARLCDGGARRSRRAADRRGAGRRRLRVPAEVLSRGCRNSASRARPSSSCRTTCRRSSACATRRMLLRPGRGADRGQRRRGRGAVRVA